MEKDNRWKSLLDNAARGREQEYTNKLFVMHNRPMFDWEIKKKENTQEIEDPLPLESNSLGSNALGESEMGSFSGDSI